MLYVYSYFRLTAESDIKDGRTNAIERYRKSAVITDF